jgi:histone H3/H4
VLELLRIIRETENDDLTNVMQKIVCSFAEQLAPIAVEICEHLVRKIIIISIIEEKKKNCNISPQWVKISLACN